MTSNTSKYPMGALPYKTSGIKNTLGAYLGTYLGKVRCLTLDLYAKFSRGSSDANWNLTVR